MFEFCVKKIHPKAILPSKGEPDSVGYDLFAVEDGFLDPLTRKLIPLGFSAAFTNGYVGRYMDRSSMGNKGIHMFGGVIDPSYRGEWKVILYNSSHDQFNWKAGEKLIQVVFMPVMSPKPVWVEMLSETQRGEGAFGSTDKAERVTETEKVTERWKGILKNEIDELELTIELVKALRARGLQKQVLAATSGNWSPQMKMAALDWINSGRPEMPGFMREPIEEKLYLGVKSGEF